MGRLQLRTERLSPDVIEAIDRACYGARTAYWRRHIDDENCTLAKFSTAMRGELSESEVIEIILNTLPAASLEQPFHKIINILCTNCGCDTGEHPFKVVDYNQTGKIEYSYNDFSFGEQVRLKSNK